MSQPGNLADLLLLSAGLVLGAQLLTWLLSLALRDSSIVDIAWGPLFILASAPGLLVGTGWVGRRWLVATMVALWGLRLGIHIALRNRGRGEDPRYAAWRAEHGMSWPLRSLFTVFLLQGVILWVVALPIQMAMSAPGPRELTPLDVLGGLLWAVGFVLEAAADAQLAAFKRRPENRGQVMTSGLWAWSRHPNYFGESVLWWGIWVLALGTPLGWASVVSPVLLTFLLVRVSGVPMTDRLMEERPGFADYARQTSPFIPRPPSSS